MTVKKILIEWLNEQLEQEPRGVSLRNSMMESLADWVKRTLNEVHNVATYERPFREVRAEWPHRFIDVSDHFKSPEKTWKLLPKKPHKKKEKRQGDLFS